MKSKQGMDQFLVYRNNKMGQPKDKGQAECRVVSVFGILAVFVTLDAEGTVNLRDPHGHGRQWAATS